MKKCFKWGISLVLLILFPLSMTGCQQNLAQQDVLTRVKQTHTINWGVKTDTRLLGLTDIKDGQVKGFDVDIAKAISHEIFGKNVTVDFTPVTSDTRLPLLKNGNIDAVAATLTITPEREKQIDFSHPYFNAGQALMVKKGSPIKSVKDLKAGNKVIGIQGSNSVENIKKYAPKAKVLQLSDATQAFSALRSGQGDAMTSDNAIMYGFSAVDPNYRLVGGTFTKEPYGIGINKGQKRFLKAINQALVKIHRNGTYDRLIDKWFGKIPGFKKEDVE